MKYYVIIALVLFASAAGGVSVPPPQTPKLPEEKMVAIDGVKLHDIIGESDYPAIPATWKLVSVSQGEKSNSSNLWFQDADGAIYLLQGFTSHNKLFLHENAYKVPSKYRLQDK